jgi:hypothetical protein
MPELSQVIATTINEWNNPFIEFAIFDTADPLRIAERLDAFCRSELGSSIAEGLFYKQSQGAVFGLALKDGRRIVVKAHQPKWSLNFLDAIYQIQSHLANCNYPCPRPLIAPKPLGRGHAMVMELIDVGTYAEQHL